MSVSLIIVLIISLSYLLVYGIVLIFAKQLESERKKNEMLVDAITAKNLTERSRKKVFDAKMDILKRRIEKQPELPGIVSDPTPNDGQPAKDGAVPPDELE